MTSDRVLELVFAFAFAALLILAIAASLTAIGTALVELALDVAATLTE